MFEQVTKADGTAVFRTARARRVRTPQEFLADKPANGFRVFVVGESSAAGVPHDVGHAFSAFLEMRLRAELPLLFVEVVNAAFPGYGTRRMLPAVEDIARHQPDLLILYPGHNEFAEPRYYAHLVGIDPRLFRLWEQARAEYLLASDLDRMPHGAPSRFNEVLRDIASERGTLFVDAAAVLEQASPHGLVGDDQFVDLVHPNLLANERIAAAIAEGMRAAGLPRPAAEWTGVDPVPRVEVLYAADPSLRTQERLVRASACILARRDACAHQAIDAVLADDPGNAPALQRRDGMAKRSPDHGESIQVPYDGGRR